MKTINKIIAVLCLGVLTFSASSCLKDDPFIEWDKRGIVIELPYNSHEISEQEVVPAENLTFGIKVNYTAAFNSDNTVDLPVDIAVDESMLTTYNNGLAADAKKYELLPASTYTLPTPIVIKKGTRLAEASMVVNTANLTPGTYYLLPLKIVGVPAGYTISGNFGHVYLRILMK